MYEQLAPSKSILTALKYVLTRYNPQNCPEVEESEFPKRYSIIKPGKLYSL